MKLLKIFFGLSLMLHVISCQPEKKQDQNLTREIQFKNDTLLKFIKGKDTLSPVFEIELAKSDYEKETGLMHRKKMESRQGMLFIYETEELRPSFYMKNTYLPLDLIYFNKNLEIVDFNLNTTPLSEELIPSEVPSIYVLELHAGSVDELSLERGNQIMLY
ncbi:DUF192 domain-containing protein [Psychroflexus sp. CAK8W]|uniref:DUF192 domain-containing protein n=1 Tax=Psychroflexus longus TaxID=2873596 RepID=A0ABS7XP95_9FLAO|nr:DUF192 domain-containing protein [Psychroflexus longus]MBZ9779836.1 DUF192 domain-containing protein [Psychroflexus longus]